MRQLTEAVGHDSGGMVDTNYQFMYQYDAMGNYTQVTRTGVADTFSVNDLNQYVTSSIPTAPSFAYDANGNLSTAGGAEYTWDQANRLIELHDGGDRTEFLYNGLGFLVERRVYLNEILDDVRRYTYSGNLLLAELDGSNNVVSTYLHGLDLTSTLEDAGGAEGFLARSTGGGAQTTYYFYDVQGNVVDMLDAGDTVLAHYDYDPFGRILAASGAGATENSIRFSTKRYDQIHEIFDFGLRFYDPRLGRWLNRDPIAERGSLNLYAFVQNNPVNQVDLLGLSSISFKPLGELLPQSAPSSFGEGEAYGATWVTDWEVDAKVRRCRGGCRMKPKKFRLKVTKCKGKGQWWWSRYKTGSEAHELNHVRIFTDNWNEMMGKINGIVATCGSRENAECRDRLVHWVAGFYHAKAHHENFDFDCQEYSSAQAQHAVCQKSQEWERKMQELENQVLATETECGGL
jgi:RHS repeat-associated protein